MDLLAEPRGAKLLIVSALIAALPVPYLIRGPSIAPFARDLAAHPERYRGSDVVLPLELVAHCWRGWAELGRYGGTVTVRAPDRFRLRAGELINARLRWEDGRFTIVDAARHATRTSKWAISSPVLVAVAALAAWRIRWDRRRRALTLAPTPEAH